MVDQGLYTIMCTGEKDDSLTYPPLFAAIVSGLCKTLRTGCSMLEKIHAECEHFWERHAGEIATGKRARIDSTGCSEKWMKNTQVVHDAFERSGCGTRLGPRFMRGLPA